MAAVFAAYAILALLVVLLVLIVHLLPEARTGLTTTSRLSPVFVSFLFNAAAALLTIAPHLAVYNGAGPVARGVASLWSVFLTSSLLAHLVPLAFVAHRSSRGKQCDRAQCALSAFLAYVYGFCPVVVVVALGKVSDLQDEAFGTWWGAYCAPGLQAWRKIRPGFLLLPLLLSAGITLFTLFKRFHKKNGMAEGSVSGSGHILVLSILTAIYLVCETTIGWTVQWWPRVLEPFFSVFMLFQASTMPYWRVYLCWLRSEPVPVLPDWSDKEEFYMLNPTTTPELRKEKRRLMSERSSGRPMIRPHGQSLSTLAEETEPESPVTSLQQRRAMERSQRARIMSTISISSAVSEEANSSESKGLGVSFAVHAPDNDGHKQALGPRSHLSAPSSDSELSARLSQDSRATNGSLSVWNYDADLPSANTFGHFPGRTSMDSQRNNTAPTSPLGITFPHPSSKLSGCEAPLVACAVVDTHIHPRAQ